MPGCVLAALEVRPSEFLGGLTEFSQFAPLLGAMSRASHQLEYRIYWMAESRLAHGRTIMTWTTGAQTTTYSYDALGNLVSVVEAARNVTEMASDALGRKSSMHDPDIGKWWYGYDLGGNLLWQVDGARQAPRFY